MELPTLDYDIIEAVSSDTLVTRVCKKLGEGWRPLGAPMHVANTWCQTVIRGDTDASHLASSLSGITQKLQELSATIDRN